MSGEGNPYVWTGPMSGTGLAASRFYVHTGWHSGALPSAGGAVDGCCLPSGGAGPACKGLPFQVELGGSVSAGGNLKTDSVGRALAWTSGATVVARALEAGGSGSIIWAVFA